MRCVVAARLCTAHPTRAVIVVDYWAGGIGGEEREERRAGGSTGDGTEKRKVGVE
jgi:hypothetical protein